ncbi:MAG: PQQ-binding-like beta-propeller repeat protein [Gemmatimonadota bacterium]|nr:MAG: PQQ-binding-like beta-propeller repeat protein [Gemmatimonadota bacterium]
MFFAFDTATGAVRWSYDIRQDGDQAYFHGEFLFAEDLVIVATDGEAVGHVYAFERTTGAVRWKYSAGENVPSDVVRSGSLVFALTQGDELLALDLATGALRRRFSSSGERPGRPKFVSSPLVVDSHVYFSGRDGVLYALDAEAGEVIWKHDLGAPLTTSPVGRGNALYVGTQDGHLVRLNAADGETEKQFNTADQIAVGYSLTVTDEGLLVPLGGRASSRDAWVLVDPELEAVRWRRDNQERWTTIRPHLRDDVVVIGDGTGRVFVLGLGDGVERQTLKVEGAVRSVGSAGDVLYVGTLEGLLYAYRLRGEPRR